MAYIYDEPSRTFGEYLLVPNLTTKDSVPANVDLTAPLVRFQADPAAVTGNNARFDPTASPLTINVPITSALMQSVSGAELAIALARCGGLSFVYGSHTHVQKADEQILTVGWADLDRDIEPDHLTSLFIPRLAVPIAAEVQSFADMVRVLRAQCPWDREQTHESLIRYLLEETYEVVDAIESGDPVGRGHSRHRR